MASFKRDDEVQRIIDRTRRKMRRWGITITFLASRLDVSRQYAWQIVHYRTFVSLEKAHEIEQLVESIVEHRPHIQTFGERLRAARVSTGLTLKQVGELIGYSWVGVERWEKDQCIPKPGVLWHLLTLYGIAGNEFTPPLAMYGGGLLAGSSSGPRVKHSVGVLGELRESFAGTQKQLPHGSLRGGPVYGRSTDFNSDTRRRIRALRNR